MAVKMKQELQQQAPVDVQELEASLTEEQLLVDEFVLCSAELEAYKPMMKTVEDHRKKLQLIAQEQDPTGTKEVTLKGSKGRSVTFKEAGTKREIFDMNGLVGALKGKVSYEDLMKLLSISLTEMDKILTPLESEKFVKKVLGSRTLKGYSTGE